MQRNPSWPIRRAVSALIEPGVGPGAKSARRLQRRLAIEPGRHVRKTQRVLIAGRILGVLAVASPADRALDTVAYAGGNQFPQVVPA